MGCTETEWLGWLPAAIGSHPWQRSGAVVQVAIAPGHLTLQWQVAPTRVLGGLARIPRLLVQFAFAGLSEQERYGFMKRFDLYMQRGGG